LHACPDLRIIASSREALGIDGENAYRVPSLSLPDSHTGLHMIEESEAVKLFVERANTVLPNFGLTESNAPIVAQICQRLDGIALAIELAASRVKLLKVEQIASRLDDAFRLLTGGSRTALPRQQTLRALIDWSYNLLSDEERIVLQRLSVFVGGWTLEAAESVCNNPNMLDVLTHLVDKSLVAVDLEHSDEPRYYLLETIRQYAREKLNDSGKAEQVRARHLDYFFNLAQKEEPKIYGSGQAEWLQKLDDESENMRTALEWSLQGNIGAGQQLAAALWWSWNLTGRRSEALGWLKRMLAATPGEESLVIARLLAGVGWMAEKAKDRKEANEKSINLFRKLGDEVSMAFPLHTLGLIAYQQADCEQAIQFIHESLDLFQRAGNKWGIRLVTGSLGAVAELQEDFGQAQKLYEESLWVCKEIGDQGGIGWNLYMMGLLAEKQGNTARAMELIEEALQIATSTKSKSMVARIQNAIGYEAVNHGDFEKAAHVLSETLDLYRKMGHQEGIAASMEGLGMVAYYQRNFPEARLHYSDSLQLFHRNGRKDGMAECLVCIGNLMGTQGSREDFARMLGMAEVIMPNIQKLVLACVHTETGNFIAAARAALGDEAYTAAYEAGRQMSLDEAVSYTLKRLGQ
jgi:non-specific serine/threonine protein kinase